MSNNNYSSDRVGFNFADLVLDQLSQRLQIFLVHVVLSNEALGDLLGFGIDSGLDLLLGTSNVDAYLESLTSIVFVIIADI